MPARVALAVLLSAVLSTAYARAFEIRTYTTSQNMDDLKAVFREHSLGLFRKHGIEAIGYRVPQDPTARPPRLGGTRFTTINSG